MNYQIWSVTTRCFSCPKLECGRSVNPCREEKKSVCCIILLWSGLNVWHYSDACARNVVRRTKTSVYTEIRQVLERRFSTDEESGCHPQRSDPEWQGWESQSHWITNTKAEKLKSTSRMEKLLRYEGRFWGKEEEDPPARQLQPIKRWLSA